MKDNLQNRIKKFNWNGLDNIYEISELNKNENKSLSSLLIRENDFGILRQELVSMIPVNLVDIEENSIVMDMCASPGNKSVQILEIMLEKGREKNILPTGVLISNELDFKRGEKLVHFLQSQPTINVISTLCPAQDFPKIADPDYQPNFVFCDVPCSGDGTLRKNKGLRVRWKPDYALNDHNLQISILENSLRLCKVGGKVVYSTCSINPIENEAVVAHILQKYQNDIELVDISSKIKNKLKINYSEGFVKWKVAYDWKDPRNIKYAFDYSQVEKNKRLIKETMFNDIYTKKNHQNNIYFSDPLNLRRCARFYSHQNNSGCFFVAVIIKKSEISNTSSNITSTPLTTETKITSIKDELKDLVKILGLENDEKYTDLITDNDDIDKEEVKESTLINFEKFVKFKEYVEKFKNLCEFYNFKNLEILSDQLYSHRTTSSKIFLFSQKLCYIVKILSDMNIKIMHSGLVCFTKERNKKFGDYRLTHYGSLLIEPFITNQKLELESNQENRNFFFELLKSKSLKFEEILSENIQIKIGNFNFGCLIIIYQSIVLACHKGINNLSIMIPHVQLNNLLLYAFQYLDENI